MVSSSIIDPIKDGHGKIYTDADSSLERLIELLQEFPPEEPTRKRYINEIISWSSKFGDLERGDPDLHHSIGSIYAQGRITRYQV